MAKRELKDEIATLNNYPYGTKQHKDILKRIQKDHLKKYSGNFILCTHGKFENVDQSVTTQDGVHDMTFVEDCLAKPTFANENFYFEDRMLCEWNMQHRQIIVNTLVLNEDNTKAIVLQEDNGRVSLIGGHVDFSSRDYHRTVSETLFANMIKETREEAGNSTYIVANMPDLPTHIVSCNSSSSRFYDNMHVFFMYVFNLDNEIFEKQAKIMKRNEKYHKPAVMDLDTIIKKTNKDSIKKIVSHVQTIKELNGRTFGQVIEEELELVK